MRLLIDLTRDDEDGAIAKRMASEIARSDFDWRRLIALAERHRVEGLLAANLAAHPSIEPQRRERFAASLKRLAVGSLALTRATMEIAGALRDADIPFVLLKGPAVADRFYRVPVARQSIDIDILVREQDASRADPILAALGFVRTVPDFDVPERCDDVYKALAADAAYSRPRDGVQLELHWRLLTNPFLLPWDFDAVRRLATGMRISETEVLVLKPAAQMVYLMCHGAKHGWRRLKWLADIDRMAAALTDEEAREVLSLSRRAGVMRMVATGLRLMQELYDLPPERFIGNAMARFEDSNVLEYMRRSIESPTVSVGARFANLGPILREHLYAMRLRPDLRYRAVVVTRLLADIHDIPTIRLSKRWLWLYMLAGPPLAIARAVGAEIKARRRFP